MERYKRWVRKNREFVHSLESLANGVTWLLPERFSNSEIGPEAVYSFLGIVGAVNQHIIDTNPAKCPPWGSEEQSLPLSLCISILKDLETVVEVAAEHFHGKEGKWNFLVTLETMKALARLASFHNSGYQMLLQGGEVVNAEHLPEATGAYQRAYRNPGVSDKYHGLDNFHRLNVQIPPGLQGRAMAALSRFGDKARMATDPSRFNGFRHVPEPALSFKKRTFYEVLSQKGVYGMFFMLGEVLSILRPLIYVSLIRKYGILSWKPWFISFAVDLTGMSFLLSSTNSGGRTGEKLYHLSTSERDEIKRRKLIWALYVIRDPFFTKYTRHHLETADKYLSHVPFVGFLTGKIVELLVVAQTRYTYTSGS
ncbi:Peroxisome biogenesis protein 16 [Apostasia shenzhenica]|uniref:Peroxisomal membrane protein PEX16 n=1 Tax=Apostasia shenzhenica TaxID=1088818 RepID=A0A2I0BF89_9ASPA|nr:Peroxisome biogenesis protein 16 [Apostasia shenzhenica]